MMAAKRRQSTEECTREALRLVTEQGDGVSETARQLGSKAHLWGRGTRDFDTQGRAAFSGNGRRAADQAAWPRWRDEHTRWRMARDMFTKARGFLARGSH